MLALANIFFFFFHTMLIVFNLFGWIWKPTRIWNLVTLSLTLVSWTIMGIWRGAMGIHETADSYVILLARKLTGWDPPVQLANSIALWLFVFSFAASLGLNTRDWRRAKRAPAQ